MIIEEKFFKLIPVNEHSPRFDLELLKTIKPRGKDAYKEFRNVAYGISLDTAIRKIAHYCVECKHKDTAIKLKEYFSEFTKEVESLTKMLK